MFNPKPSFYQGPGGDQEKIEFKKFAEYERGLEGTEGVHEYIRKQIENSQFKTNTIAFKNLDLIFEYDGWDKIFNAFPEMTDVVFENCKGVFKLIINDSDRDHERSKIRNMTFKNSNMSEVTIFNDNDIKEQPVDVTFRDSKIKEIRIDTNVRTLELSNSHVGELRFLTEGEDHFHFNWHNVSLDEITFEMRKEDGNVNNLRPILDCDHQSLPMLRSVFPNAEIARVSFK